MPQTETGVEKPKAGCGTPASPQPSSEEEIITDKDRGLHHGWSRTVGVDIKSKITITRASG
jgi:hypothetical protein